MNNRLKAVRLALNLSQEEFGSKIGIKSRAHISSLESGSRNITDRIISDICREYGVREEWLRHGTGEMFSSGQLPPAALADLAQEFGLDSVDVALVSEYIKLNKNVRDTLKQKMREIFFLEEDPEEARIQAELASYERELRAEKGEKSSASDTTNAKEA